MGKWLRVFVMEDNNSKVTLDQLRASNHVRHVLNEMRRSSKSNLKEKVFFN